jgi:uncharacterized membrane protein (DUF106 family)
MLEWLIKFVHENPFLGVFLISVILSFILMIITKFTTNQARMKELKEKQKECQQRMKECKDPQKVMEIQKEMMGYSGELMRHSFKPTLITILPILFIFSWANATITYMPIIPQEQFSVNAFLEKGTIGNLTIDVPSNITLIENISQKEIPSNSQVQWNLKGDEGEYSIKFKYNENVVSKKVIITKGPKYAPVRENYKQSPIQSVLVGNKKLAVIPFLGGIGWLWSYIIFSIILSLIWRKVLNVQ